MQTVDPAVFVADRGLEGCRHARPQSRRQVLLMDEETLQQLELSPKTLKENVTTRGIDLTALPVDTRVRLGQAVELLITGPCHPCDLMEEIRPGLKEELRGRRGVLAWVEKGGEVRVGDAIEALAPEGARE